MKVVIIGGGSAGTTCAFELRKLDKDAEITILEKTGNTEYSPCALPYVISGEIKNLADIYLFSRNNYSSNKIDLSLNSEVESIDKENKMITYTKEGEIKEVGYDKLVLATGSSAFVPPIDGLGDSRYHVLKTIEDAKIILEGAREGSRSVVVGAGLIGVELAHSLAQRQEQVTLVEVKENILPGLLDKKMSEKLKEYLEQIKVYEGKAIEKIADGELVIGQERISFDRLFLCTGITPALELARDCGLHTDQGIVVDGFMQTSDKDIYACGDCVESRELNSGQKILSALGTAAVRQAKVIAGNLSGREEKFPPVMNSSISKVGNVYVGSVGLTEIRAKELGIRCVSAVYTGTVRAEYFDSKSKISIKLIVECSGKIIGGQIVGDAEVVGRLDLIALAISKEMHIKSLAELETCYNPPTAPIFDPLSVAAQICEKKLQVKGGK